MHGVRAAEPERPGALGNNDYARDWFQSGRKVLPTCCQATASRQAARRMNPGI